MPTLKRYYGGKQNNNSSSAPKAFKKGMESGCINNIGRTKKTS
jgi:hypothetical protein